MFFIFFYTSRYTNFYFFCVFFIFLANSGKFVLFVNMYIDYFKVKQREKREENDPSYQRIIILGNHCAKNTIKYNLLLRERSF